MYFIKSEIIDNCKFDFFKLTSNNLSEVIQCKDNVISGIESNNLFIAPSNRYIQKILENYGQVIGVYKDNELTAFSSIIFPRLNKSNLGYEISLGQKQLVTVAQFEHGLVQIDYRRKNLLEMMLNIHIQSFNNTVQYLISTVSPENYASLITAFRIKQRIVKHFTYLGFDRYLLVRQFNNENIYQKYITINYDNRELINYYINRGFEGLQLVDNNKNIVLGVH